MTVRALPRSLEALRGRRAARWIRESTAGQADNVGPDAQTEQQTRAIERWEPEPDAARCVLHDGSCLDASPYERILAGSSPQHESRPSRRDPPVA